jgi:predicted MFS family arabinose efflux permease
MEMEDVVKTLPSGLKLNKNLRSLIFVNTVINFTVGMFTPFYAVFVAKIGGGAAIAGISWALFSVVSGILILLFSKWELRVKRQFILLAFGYIFRSAVFLSYAFMHSISQLLITQVLWAIASAVGTPAFDALYTSSTSKETAIVEWADWEGVSAIATGIAALVGGLLIQTIGFKILFIIMAIISVSLGSGLLYQRYKIQKFSFKKEVIKNV